MDQSFKEWLEGQNLSRSTLKALRKEDVTDRNTLKSLKDSDLDTLKAKHKLPMGQYVLIRYARDSLLAGAGTKDPRNSVLKQAPHPSAPTERERLLAHATPCPGQEPRMSEAAQKRKLKREEIREKYKLRSEYGATTVGGDRTERGAAIREKYKLRSGYGAGVSSAEGGRQTVSQRILGPQTSGARTATQDTAVTSQMKQLHAKGKERGQKLSVLDAKSHDMVVSAMDYEKQCEEVSDKLMRGKKKTKENDYSALPQAAKSAPKSHTLYSSLPPSTHTVGSHLPPLPNSSLVQSPHSDPLRRTHNVSRSTSPETLSYNAEDQSVRFIEPKPTSTPELKTRTNCSCCVVM